MSYDPNKPTNGALISAPELRDQFQGIIDLVVSNQNNTSANSNSVNTLGMFVSNPPTQTDVQMIADKLDELILSLRR